MAKKHNLTALKWDGDVSKLKRGDTLAYMKASANKKTGAGQHTFIYLGNNLVAEGSRRKHYYGIYPKTAGEGVLNRKDKKIFFIARAKN